MGRSARHAALVLCVSGGCLYTGAINEGPVVSEIEHPSPLFAGQGEVTLSAKVRDPDGDDVTLAWQRIERRCEELDEAAWAEAAPSTGPTFTFVPAPRRAFCVRVTATDEHGGRAAPVAKTLEPTNRPPVARLRLVEPKVEAGPVPLYARARVSADETFDPDGDEVKIEMDPSPEAAVCGRHQWCLALERAGRRELRITATDGLEQRTETLSFTVGDDQPPCVPAGATDPDPGTPLVVLPLDGPGRLFQVRQVSDDGHPHPPGPRGGPRFVWSVGEPGRAFRLQHGQEGPSFPVGRGLLDDPRPGAELNVRLEVRNPGDDGAEDLGCSGRLCPPTGCHRWIVWRVQFR